MLHGVTRQNPPLRRDDVCMNEELWKRARTAQSRGVITEAGFQHAQITQLLRVIHGSSERSLDLLEQLYDIKQRHYFSRYDWSIIMKALTEYGGQGNWDDLNELYRPCMTVLAKWVVSTGIIDHRALEIGLSVISNPRLNDPNRRKTLRDTLLESFNDVEANLWLLDAEIPEDFTRIVIPTYFPFAMDAGEYRKICHEIIEKHIAETIEIYGRAGFQEPADVTEHEKHLRIIAEHCVTGLSYRKLAVHLAHHGIVETDPSASRTGLTYNNIQTIVSRFIAATGVQLLNRSELNT